MKLQAQYNQHASFYNGGIFAAALAALAYTLWSYHFKLPLWQQFDLIFAYDAWQHDRFSWRDLFTASEGHVRALPQLLQLSLAKITGWQLAWDSALSLLCVLAVAYYIFKHIRNIPHYMALILLLWLLLPDHIFGLSWAGNLGFYLGLALSVAALDNAHQQRWWRCFLFCLLAIFSDTMGLAALLSCTYLAIKSPHAKTKLWVIACGIIGYLYYHYIIQHMSAGTMPAGPWMSAQLFFNLLGSALYNPSYYLAIPLGIILFACCLHSMWRMHGSIGNALILFGLLAILTHSLFHIGIVEDQITLSRSLLLSTLCLIGVMISWNTSRNAPIWLLCIMLVISVPKLISSYQNLQHTKWVHAGYEELYYHMQGAYPTLDEGVLAALHHSEDVGTARHGVWLMHRYKLNLYR